MKSASELTDFYYRELYPSLSELEKTRKEILSRLKLYAGMGIVALLLTIAWIGKKFGLFHPAMMAVLIGFIALSSIIYRWTVSGYAKDFKERIITPLIHAIDHLL